MPLHIETPLTESLALEARTGKKIRLKLEALQPSGSFKLRGIGAACEGHADAGKRRFVSSSGGNAGIAVAHAGRLLSISVLIVVPETTGRHAIALMEQQKAEVVVHGSSWMEADAHALALIGDQDAYIHPFDDPVLWSGHATMIDEIAAVGPKPGAVVVSVGGGGLLAGVVHGLRRNHWQDVPVIAVETEGAASFFHSVKAGERVTLQAIETVALTLGAKQVCSEAFDLSKTHDIRPVLVSDAAAISACGRFLDDHRLLVEPACGASLSLAYDAAPILDDQRDILIIVCGGATTSRGQLQQWEKGLAGI